MARSQRPKKKKGKGRRRNPRSNNGQPSSSGPVVQISPCAMSYAQALTDTRGLHRSGVLPCVPDNIIVPSSKFGAYSRGVMVLGTAGVGFISMGDNPTSANWIHTTDATWTGFAVDIDNTTIGVSSTAGRTNMPTPSATLTEVVEYRVVGKGLYVKYIGTQLNMAGYYGGGCRDNNGNWDNASSGEVTSSYENSSVQAVGKGEFIIHWTPQTREELDYKSSVILHTDGFADMLVMVAGGVAGESFYYEAFEYVESTGYQVGGATPSHSDPNMGKIVSASQQGNNFAGSMKILASSIYEGTRTLMANPTARAAAESSVRWVLGIPPSPLLLGAA